MDGVDSAEPFAYPAGPHVRKHGPAGYKSYGRYKVWLRDEFDFRCVYCLRRETWDRRRAMWVVEHVIPRAERADLETDYTNLVLACVSCNSWKKDSWAPDPCASALGNMLSVSEDGVIAGHSEEGRKLIEVAGLGDDDSTRWRRLMISIIRNVKRHEPETYREMMGFPSDLPDLASREKRSRGIKNSKPEGARDCRHAQRAKGTLPNTY